MKTVVLLYETCCIYEIVITNYFLQCCGHEIVFATVDGKSVIAQEKFSLNPTCALKDIDPKEVELFLVPGGDISSIANDDVYSFIRAVVDNKQLVAGICNGAFKHRRSAEHRNRQESAQHRYRRKLPVE